MHSWLTDRLHIWSCSGRSRQPPAEGSTACCCSAGRNARLVATGLPLHPTKATAGHTAVPTHCPAPSPEDVIPCPWHWGGTRGLGCKDRQSRVTYSCYVSCLVQDGWLLCQHPLAAHRCLLEGQMGCMDRDRRHEQTAQGRWSTAGWGGSPRAAKLPLVLLDLGVIISCPYEPWASPCMHPLSFALDSCVLPRKEPGRSQKGFGASPGDAHPMMRGYVGPPAQGKHVPDQVLPNNSTSSPVESPTTAFLPHHPPGPPQSIC